MKYVIGIDIGSTHLKACLADETMQIVKIVIVDNDLDVASECGYCYDSEIIWRKLSQAICELSLFTKGEICSIGLTGMADSGLPVDEEGKPLFPVIPWSNNCGFEFREEITKHFSISEIYRLTGQTLHPKFAFSRLLYLREYHRDIFKRMHVWLSLYDFILLKLTGRLITDRSLACRTLMFNINTLDWESKLVDYVDMKGRLPEVVDMGQIAGPLDASAAQVTQLPSGIPVVCGGHDHLCALAATGAFQKGEVLNSLGTSEVYVGLVEEKNEPALCLQYGINQGCFAGGRRYWMANLPSSGASIEWLRKLLSYEKPLDYRLFNEVENLQDNGGVLFIPHINGRGSPHPDPESSGMFLGLKSTTTIYNLIQAVYEGIGFESRWILDSIEEAFNLKVERLIAVGGGTKNIPLLATKADISGRDIYIPSMAEITLLGAANFAAQAAGLADSMISTGSFTKRMPGPQKREAYGRRFQVYKDLHRDLNGLFKL